jgi:peroxiredoxin
VTLRIGQPAPDFELRDQHGQPVRLSAFRGRKAVVVMFYPFAFSRVCTGELGAVRDDLGTFESADVQLVAVSCDPMFSLRAYAEQEGLTFPLLADFWPHGEVARSFGVFDADRGCADRSTFIVDKRGVVRWMVHSAMPDARDLRAHARALAEVS